MTLEVGVGNTTAVFNFVKQQNKKFVLLETQESCVKYQLQICREMDIDMEYSSVLHIEQLQEDYHEHLDEFLYSTEEFILVLSKDYESFWEKIITSKSLEYDRLSVLYELMNLMLKADKVVCISDKYTDIEMYGNSIKDKFDNILYYSLNFLT